MSMEQYLSNSDCEKIVSVLLGLAGQVDSERWILINSSKSIIANNPFGGGFHKSFKGAFGTKKFPTEAKANQFKKDNGLRGYKAERI